jgi:hypothetical protein
MDWEQHYRQLSQAYSTEYAPGSGVAVAGFFSDTWDILTDPIEEQVANFTMARDNLKTLNSYIHAQHINTPEAATIASDWSRWWDTTGNPENYSLKIPPEVWDEARNRKLKFDLANAVTAKQKDAVINVAKTGMSTEQMRGQEDRRDPTTGAYYVPPTPPPPTFPPWVKPVALGAAALGLGFSVVPMLRKLILHV